MSDDTRSVTQRSRRPPPRRVLVVSNVSPESSSDEGIPPPAEPYKPYSYPRPLPSPSSSIPSAGSYYNDSGSPAVESTPPPSTPGLTGPGIHLTDDGTVRQDTIKPAPSDRSDNTPPGSRPRLYERMRSQQIPVRRGSLSGARPATSPTVATPDSYAPVPTMFRSSPMEKVIVLVTTDAENLQVVDITGAMTPAFIRERIFTKLQISDEDQATYSIYRTEVGQFAIGEALTDEELFDLYRQRGDHSGNLKLLVSHSSATVHEAVYDQITSTTVNTIPPPVLPQQDLYAPLRPNRATRLRQNSQSSASEAHHAEVGYEASVSDDLDHGDTDVVRDAREPVRPTVHARTLPTPGYRPSSPPGRHRSRSPAGMLSPERSVLRSPEAHPYRPDPFYSNVSMPTLSGTSPKSSRFVDGTHPTPTEPYSSALNEPHVERERSHTNDGQPSSFSNQHWRAHREREERAQSDRERRRREPHKERDVRKEGSPRNMRTAGYDPLESRSRRDPWIMVPSASDLPSGGYKNDLPATTPEGRRFPLSPPSIPGMTSALALRPGESSRKKSNKQVPITWAVTWKHPNSKPEPKPPQHTLVRGAAKSMNNLKDAYNSQPLGTDCFVPQHPWCRVRATRRNRRGRKCAYRPRR
ncbi:hypothetical protein C2E23DRAFT_542672 [Lenzites betulinus]|nr:hypothetical protein C2E23DRAFT_542672 [Lenzites betulinus]